MPTPTTQVVRTPEGFRSQDVSAGDPPALVVQSTTLAGPGSGTLPGAHLNQELSVAAGLSADIVLVGTFEEGMTFRLLTLAGEVYTVPAPTIAENSRTDPDLDNGVAGEVDLTVSAGAAPAAGSESYILQAVNPDGAVQSLVTVSLVGGA